MNKNPALLAAAALLLTAVPAGAITRYTSTAMTCDRIQATIARDGAAIMRYQSKRNPGLPLYNRYVNDDRFCKQDEYTRTVFIPAADTAQCPVYECRPFDLDDHGRFIRRH